MTAWGGRKGPATEGAVPGGTVLGNLKEDKLAPAYFLAGDSAWMKAGIIARLKELSVPGKWRGASVETVWAGEAGEADVADTAATPPFGGPRRFLLVRSMEEFRPRKRGARKASTTPADSPLASYLRSPFPTTVLVMVSESRPMADWEGDPILKGVRGCGVLVACDAPENWDLRKWIGERAAVAGLKLEPGAVEELAERSGGDQFRLENEMDKLSAWAGPGAGVITRAQVEDLTGESAPPSVFQFLDVLFVDRNATKALVMLGKQLGEMHPLQLHATTASQLRKLIALKQAVKENWPSGRIARELKLPYSLVERLTMMVSRTRPERFAELLRALAMAEASLKRSGDPRMVLEGFVLEACGRR